MRVLLALLFAITFSQALAKEFTSNLMVFECRSETIKLPIILKQNENSWETVSIFGKEPVKVLSLDSDTYAFPQVNFVQQFLKRKDGVWNLIEVDQGEITTLECDQINQLAEIISEGIAPLIAEDINSLRLKQEDLLENEKTLSLLIEKLRSDLDGAGRELKALRDGSEIKNLKQDFAVKTTQMNEKLAELLRLLEKSEATGVQNTIQLQNSVERLNAALKKAAAEERRRRKLENEKRIWLEKEKLLVKELDLLNFKSEFFDYIRKYIGDHDRIIIVDDRLILSSEVLFALGSANLSAEGAAELMKVGQILNEIMSEIPENINWVIRVDGHTDNSPIRNSPRFKDNWELSQARALSVVRFMITELYIPPARLSANGFGEFQPLNRADTPVARKQNRRIELTITHK